MASLTLQHQVCPCDRPNMPRTSTCSIRRFPSWYGAALSMDTVTRACALKLQSGKRQLPKPKRAWCSAPTGTFTQNTCGAAPYATRRVRRLAVRPGPPPRRTTRLDPKYLQEQNHLPHLQRANQPANRPPRLPAKHTTAREQLPTPPPPILAPPILAPGIPGTHLPVHGLPRHLNQSLRRVAQPPQDALPSKPPPAIQRLVQPDQPPAPSRVVK